MARLSGKGGARSLARRSSFGSKQRRRPVRGWGRKSRWSLPDRVAMLGSLGAPRPPRSLRPADHPATHWSWRLTWSAATPLDRDSASRKIPGPSVSPAAGGCGVAGARAVARRGSAPRASAPLQAPAPGLAAPPSRSGHSSRAAPAKGAAPPSRAISVCFSCLTDVSQNTGHMFRGNKLGMSANTLGLRWLFQLPHGRLGGWGCHLARAPTPK